MTHALTAESNSDDTEGAHVMKSHLSPQSSFKVLPVRSVVCCLILFVF